MQRWAQEFQDGVTEDAVYLHVKLNNETGERRVFVKEIVGDFATTWFGSGGSFETAAAINNTAEIPLSIVRAPFWEAPTTSPMPQKITGITAPVLMYDYTTSPGGAIEGDIGARVVRFNISNDPETSTTIERMWCGIRSAKFGDPGNLVYLWECEDGTNVGSGPTVADAVNASASGGYEVQGTPSASDTWEKYMTILVSDAVSNSDYYDDNYGTFLWLLRYAATAANVFDVQLRFGFNGMASDDEWVRGKTIQITGGSGYSLDAAGVASIPFGLNRFQGLPMREAIGTWGIQVWARQTSGAGSVYFDCIVPIPMDEGWLIVEDMGITPEDIFYFGEMADSEELSVSFDTSGPIARPRIDTHNFRLPKSGQNDGNMVIAFAGDASNILDHIEPGSNSAYYRRWASLRGTESEPY
jgi:hypothetical protein